MSNNKIEICVALGDIAMTIRKTASKVHPGDNCTRTRVLIIDDSEADSRLISHQLSLAGFDRYYESDRVSDIEHFLETVSCNSYDVFLVDYDMGKFDAIDVINELKRRQIDAPIIVVTGLSDVIVDIRVMESGASYFMDKDEITPELLDRNIRYAIKKHQKDQKETLIAEYSAQNVTEESKEYVAQNAAKICDALNFRFNIF